MIEIVPNRGSGSILIPSFAFCGMMCKLATGRFVKILPIEFVEIAEFQWQNVAQGRILISAGPKTVQPTKHDQPGAVLDVLPQAVRSSGRKAIESKSPMIYTSYLPG